jgi:hypothetical protein
MPAVDPVLRNVTPWDDDREKHPIMSGTGAAGDPVLVAVVFPPGAWIARYPPGFRTIRSMLSDAHHPGLWIGASSAAGPEAVQATLTIHGGEQATARVKGQVYRFTAKTVAHDGEPFGCWARRLDYIETYNNPEATTAPAGSRLLGLGGIAVAARAAPTEWPGKLTQHRWQSTGALSSAQGVAANVETGAGFDPSNTASPGWSLDGEGVHTYPGGDRYMDGGGVVWTLHVRGILPPTAAFTWRQRAGDYTVAFTDASQNGIVTWSWDFGDHGGQPVTTASPTHVYVAEGTYLVALTVTNEAGTDTVSHQVQVLPPKPVPGFLVDQLSNGWLELVDTSQLADTVTYTVDGVDIGFRRRYRVPGWETAGSHEVVQHATNEAGESTRQRQVWVGPAQAHGTELRDGTKVRISYTPGPGQPSDWLLVGMTCELRSASWTWGASQDDGVLTEVGESAFRMTAYDPERTVAATLGSTIRVYLDWAVVYQGVVRELSYEGDILELAAIDELGRLARIDVDADGHAKGLPQQQAGARLEQLLDVAGWPSSARDIDPDPNNMQAVELTSANLWEAMRQVAHTTLGTLWLGQDGVMRYRTRSASYLASEATVSVGCDGLEAMSISRRLADDTMANSVTAKSKDQGHPIGHAEDIASIEDYGLRTCLTQGLLFVNQAGVGSWASFVLGRHKLPWWTVPAVRVEYDKAIGTADFGDHWEVVDTHHGPRWVMRGRLLGLSYELDSTWCTVTAIVGLK